MNKTPVHPLRIMLVDDSELVRRGIKMVLNIRTSPALHVVGEASTVAEAVAECLRVKPDIVLLDIRLPDGTGFEACRRILKLLPKTRVVMLTSHSSDHYVYEAATAGAQGYLMKEIDPKGLVQAMHDVAAGRTIFDAEATGRALRILRGGVTEASEHLGNLSPQERRVLELVAKGLTNREVGEQLALSENTVKNYLVSVFEKLKIRRRSQAAALFAQNSTPGDE